ncbi:MAG: TldD/PmbA family protein [Candidatus Margulisiibacteriota bacterium]
MFEKLTAALELAKKNGADEAEVFASRTVSTRVNVRDQEVEELKQSEDAGFSIRVIKDKSLGFAFSSDMSAESLKTTVDKAIAAAGVTTPDEFNVIGRNAGGKTAPLEELNIYDQQIPKLELTKKIEIAKQIEAVACGHEKVAKTEVVSYSDHVYDIFLANTAGFCGGYQGTYCGGTAEVIAQAHGSSSEGGFGIDFSTAFSNLNPEMIGNEAARRAVQMLDAATIKTQTMEVVFSPLVAIDFLEVISPMVLADQVLKGKSLLCGREAQKIASDKITIIDDGILSGGAGSAPFDAEGVPTRRTVIVEDGVLKTFLFDEISAAKSKKQSTGNASRSSFMSLPSVGTNNIYFQAGKKSEEEIISGVDKGFYIARVMGLHTANPISGDFSLGASGLLIENGKLTTPVRGVVIAGNLLELLQKVTQVGNNLRFVLGTGAPTIHFGELTVSGN